MEPTTPLVDDLRDELVDTRRALHARPELAFAERETTALVLDRLRTLDVEVRPCPTPTGAVAVLDGGRPGRTVLLRADLDGLPVDEAVDLPYRSTIEGQMHACGHDAHVAMLLGAARVLASRREELPGRYVFFFQPAEELGGGAQVLLDAGALDGLGIDHTIGCHITSMAPVGIVGFRPGVFFSAIRPIAVRLRGAGGHGAMATKAGNVVLAVADLAGRLGSVVQGIEHEGCAGACNPGVIQAGTAPNVVPQSALVQATIRTFTPEQEALALDRLHMLADAVAREYDVDVDVDVEAQPGAPAVTNDADATAVVAAAARRAHGDGVLTLPSPLPPSDDVSVLLDRFPGTYFLLGAALADGSSGAHHSPTFAIDEAALPIGTTVLADGAVALAARPRA